MNKRSKKIPFHETLAVGGTIKVLLEPADRLSDIIDVVQLDTDKGVEELTREWGIIVDISPGAFGGQSPKPDSRIKVGDMVIFKKYQGHTFTDPNNDQVNYKFINDDQVWGFIPKSKLEEYGYDHTYAAEGTVSRTQRNAVVEHLRKSVGE